MAANTSLRVTELDFDTIKTNLKNYLRSQSRFQDFDFEGSGMSVLLDLLAYNTHYNAFYLNMIANEMFLDTSRIRQSTISHAKLINYVPDSRHAAEAKVNITVTPSNNEANDTILTLQKYTRILGASIDGVNYPFVTLDSVTTSKVNGAFQFANVILKQGEVVTRQFLMEPSNTSRRFEIPSANVDTETLVVTIQQSASNTETFVYELADDLTELSSNSRVYFVEENSAGNYTVYFGDNVIGKRPDDNSIVTFTYLDTLGESGNKINLFSSSVSIGPFNDSVAINSWGPSYSGSEKETIEQLKYRAPYFYTAQNRAVTINDYETLIMKDYENIESVAVWGGEDNDPPVYGKVYLSLKTKENYFLTNLEKERIKETLINNRNILTVVPEIIDPSYNYALIRGRIYYNQTLTSKTAGEIRNFVAAAIEDYTNENLDRFKGVFHKSKLQQYIEDSEQSITGSDIRVLLQKRVDLTLDQSKNYVVEFDVPIKKGDFVSALSSYPAVTILDSTNVQRQAFFEEVASVDSGIEKIEIVDGGINYREAPTITISGDGTGATAIARVAGGRIYEIAITNRGTNYSRAFVTITGGEGAGAIVEPVLQSRVGKLRTYYVDSLGVKTIINGNAGDIDYDRGTVTLLSLNPISLVKNEFYDDNTLTISVPVEREIISTLRNKIVTIDVDDPLAIQVDVIAGT